MSKAVKVSNNHFDEALEMSDTDEVANPTYHHQQDRSGIERGHPRGDSPPSAKLSVSDYDEGDNEEHLTHQAEDEAFEETMKKVGPLNSEATNIRKHGSTDLKHAHAHSTETDEDHDNEDDHHESFLFQGETLGNEIKQLLEYIERYSVQEQDLDVELKSFIPDLIPAIGDIDAFIKIPRVDQKPDILGFALLDEPAAAQSDPSVLDLHLRAVSKSATVVPQVVRSLESSALCKDPKLIDAWIKNIKDLHGKNPPPSVNYSRRMPDIEDLMQVWPPALESAFESTQLLHASIDLPLSQYAAVVALILDIPTHQPSPTDKPDAKRQQNSLIESLHVVFTLYLEFQNSVHFKAMERGRNSFTAAPLP
ncbi:hypothetical protein BDV3_003198 [Batrachochytrium dendrobatidis]